MWEKSKSLEKLRTVESPGALSRPVPSSSLPAQDLGQEQQLFGGKCAGQRGAEVTAPLDPLGCSLCVRVKALLSFLGSLLCFRHCKEDEEKGCVHTMQSEMRDVSKRIPPQSPSFLLSFSFHHFTLSHLSPLSENLSPSVKYVLETYFISLVLLSDLLNLS